MDKLFRQVSVKERLPNKDGNYWCKMSYIDSALYQQNFKAEFGGFGDNSMYEYWLEEVELPTEEDINWKYPLNSNELHKTTLNVGCRNGAKYILNTLKGEKK